MKVNTQKTYINSFFKFFLVTTTLVLAGCATELDTSVNTNNSDLNNNQINTQNTTTNNSNNNSTTQCTLPSTPVHISNDTERYVVNRESLKIMGRGKYRFPAGSPKGSSFAFKFESLATQRTSVGSTITSTTGSAGWLVSISKCPGDFKVADNCISTGTDVAHVKFATGPFETEPKSYYCKLEPGQHYYVNIQLTRDYVYCGACDFYVEGLPISQYIWE